MEEQKTSRVPLEPVYHPPNDEMIHNVHSRAGIAEVCDLTFRLDNDFRAGSYILLCKDVTPGLPPRMRMKHTKVLFKLVDLDPPPEDEQPAAGAKAKGKKR